MNPVQFILHPQPTTDSQFNQRIQETIDNVMKCGFGANQHLQNFNVPVKEVVLGPTHIGILLSNGRAFRAAFSVNTDKLNLIKPEVSKNLNDVNSNSASPQRYNATSTTRPVVRSRARLLRTGNRSGAATQPSGSRNAGVIIGGSGTSRSLVTVPSTYVPEELISQAEVVLQGKSRNLIIRELQRTNLDVNLAVNNLLSRDDEETEETEESSDNYVPDDLISLLDNGFQAEGSGVVIDPSDGLFSDELFHNYSNIRNLLFDRIRTDRHQTSLPSAETSQPPRLLSVGSGPLSGNTSLSSQPTCSGESRESFSRWRDRQCYNTKRWTNKEEGVLERDSDIRKKESILSESPVWISEELQQWPGKIPIRFSKIAALYSEFIAITEEGQLCQWRWSDAESYQSDLENVYHPKTVSLGLFEKIRDVSANLIRCSVLTESSRVATWMDEQLGYIGAKLEHAAVTFNEFTADQIISIHVCPLYTAVRTERNLVYWWGVLPFDERFDMWDKCLVKPKRSSKNNATNITVGCQVIMKKSPMFQSGSVAFTFSNGIPKIGQLQNSVWGLTEPCRFKLLNVEITATDKYLHTPSFEKEMFNQNSNGNKSTVNSICKETNDRIDMPPPPSPASSTCSDPGIVKRAKRLTTKEDGFSGLDHKDNEEHWNIKDVVFIEDKIGPIGKVLKVDGEYAAVKFPPSNNTGKEECKDDDWQHCRLLPIDDLQLFKTGNHFRGSDSLQRSPKRVNISHGVDMANFQLLALTADVRGIHIIKKIGSDISYSLYNLYNGKQEQNCTFPVDSTIFLGSSPSNITMVCNSDSCGNNGVMILRDGNKALFPLVKDSLGSIQDPQWFNSPPVASISMTTLPLPITQKLKICMTALVFDAQGMMQCIFRSDYKMVVSILMRIESADMNAMCIVEECCDGGRNIIHASALMCAPTSNKDADYFNNDDNKANALPRSKKCPPKTDSNSSETFYSQPESANFVSGNGNRESRNTAREAINRVMSNCNLESPNQSITENSAEYHMYIPSEKAEHLSNEDDEEYSRIEPITQRENAFAILRKLLTSTAISQYLPQLLSATDAQGRTPFMLAINCRAYEAAAAILDTIIILTENNVPIKEAMIFPSGASLDQSPMYELCCNDTCSFTWTGADHINQKIFECRTCGLTGSLCCCTECALVCHKGHDCKLKHTSPTAYCDCWEKCKCKALIAGNQNKRYEVLCKLVECTDLSTRFNRRGESIVLFLIQTVGRQAIEQRQWRTNLRIRGVGANSNTNNPTNAATHRKSIVDLETEMPDHDIEPPRFARNALERLLESWSAVKAVVMAGSEKIENPPQQYRYRDIQSSNSDIYNLCLHSQSGTALLDKFTHNLLAKCPDEHIKTLLKTFVLEMKNDNICGRREEAENVARRFVRSVTRVFVIFNLERQPNPEKKRNMQSTSIKHIDNCICVFKALTKISIEELCEASEALIAPVRLGVVRPTAAFNTTAFTENTDDIFNVDPLDLTSMAELGLFIPNEISSEQAHLDNRQSYINIESVEGLHESVDIRRQRNELDNEVLGVVRSNEPNPEDESDIDFPFNDAETDSDSEDNQNNVGTGRSVQEGAIVGTESDDSVDSSAQEEGSDEGDSEENSDEFISNEQLERRPNVNISRSDLGSHPMQWAIRNRDISRASVRLPPGSNLVFIDPVAIRRSTIPSNAASSTSATPEHNTMASTASNLSRAYGIILRTVSELLNALFHNDLDTSDTPSKIQRSDFSKVQISVENRFKATWDWMYSVMESTEAQLKFGAYLTNYMDPAHSLNATARTNGPQNQSSATIGLSARKEFFTYCLSLMRAHTSEHRDALPVLDVTGLRHVAYILDAFIFYMRNDSQFFSLNFFETGSVRSGTDGNDTDDEANGSGSKTPTKVNFLNASLQPSCSKRQTFFSRSDSTLSLGCLAPESFDMPLDIAMPLADKPHLLQPDSKRQDLFANVPLLETEMKLTNLGLNNVSSTHLGYLANRDETKTTDQATQCNLYLDKQSVTEYAYPASTVKIPDQISRKRVICEDPCERDSTLKLNPNVKRRKFVDESGDESLDDNSLYILVAEENTSPLSDINKLRPEVIISPDKDISQIQNSTSGECGVSAAIVSPSVIVRSVPENLSEIVETNTERDNELAFFKHSTYQQKASGISPLFQRGSLLYKSNNLQMPSWNVLLSKWKLSFELFGRIFMDDVGMEYGSVLPELRGFSVKELRFRRHMEKLRNAQQRDLTLSKLDRDRESLITQTFKELNSQFGNHNRRIHPSLTFNRVKVTFKDEPGEGSGVARSFYTSISEALLSQAKLPNLEVTQGIKYGSVAFGSGSVLRGKGSVVPGRDSSNIQRRNAGTKIFWRNVRDRKILNYEAKVFTPSVDAGGNEQFPTHLRQLGERLYPKVQSLSPMNAPKITGMLLELPTPMLLTTLATDDVLRQKVNEALDIITAKQKSEQSHYIGLRKGRSSISMESADNDNEPLFYSPGKRGFYTPRQGLLSAPRLNAFRNIGRLIGICLLQNELLPIFLQRHVLKYILGRKIQFHDIAFYDPALYESFRQIILKSQLRSHEDYVKDMDLFFMIDLNPEEGGGSHELIIGGREIPVTSDNVFEYIRRYTEYRLVTTQERALEALKDGVFDVLPENCMNSLTAEDLRLLLNGAGDINVSTLISYTTFNDESSEGPDRLFKFKRWFWAIVEKMDSIEKQDLVYFWTGSPALPASEEGFQPLPSVTIRPADDTHLPTANTCISRLYIPLYSTKSILKGKLLMAIKSKNFGFV